MFDHRIERLHRPGMHVTPWPAQVRSADANVSSNVIMVKTGHKSLRSVGRYVKPGLAAVHEATETLSGPGHRG